MSHSERIWPTLTPPNKGIKGLNYYLLDTLYCSGEDIEAAEAKRQIDLAVQCKPEHMDSRPPPQDPPSSPQAIHTAVCVSCFCAVLGFPLQRLNTRASLYAGFTLRVCAVGNF